MKLQRILSLTIGIGITITTFLASPAHGQPEAHVGTRRTVGPTRRPMRFVLRQARGLPAGRRHTN